MREKVGVMFGNPETTPGGKALKFYASVRIDIRRKDTLKDAAGNAVGDDDKRELDVVADPRRVALHAEGSAFDVRHRARLAIRRFSIRRAIAGDLRHVQRDVTGHPTQRQQPFDPRQASVDERDMR